MAISKVKLSSNNTIYTETINNNFSDLDLNKVDKIPGKGLSTNDYTTAEKEKLSAIEGGAQVNKIEKITVNGAEQTITSKTVDVTVPTKLTDLTNDDNFVQDANYVHTDNNYTTGEKEKLAGIAEQAQVNVIETVKVNGTPLSVTNKAVDVIIPAAAEYTIVEQQTAETGYAKTYYMTKDGAQVGAKINIPKDLVVESGDVKEVEEANVPYQGAVVGDKYIDLVIANATNQHIYIPVKELVDVYKGGNGIEISTGNVVSIKLDSANANGLATTTSGLKLDVASTSANGAMSSADKTKLDGIDTGAQVNKIETVKVNGSAQTITSKSVDISVPTQIFKTVKANGVNISASTTTDTVEIVPGSNITITGDATTKKVTIAATVPPAISAVSFTAADAGWGTADSDGNCTLEITNTGVALAVMKSAAEGGYESVMATLRFDGTKFYITADEKFGGQVYYYA